MSKDLTEKQRTAMAAAEAARTAGLTLIAHCRAEGLNVREVYDAIAALRRSGVLPKAEKSRRRKGEFVAVRVVKTRQPSLGVTPPGAGMVCRLVHGSGLVIECGQWPPAAWLLSLTSGVRDAAS
jgi:hypothetical protein